MNLGNYRQLCERDKYILKCIQSKSCSVREIALNHKTLLPENIYQAVTKLVALNYVEKIGSNPKLIQITPDGLEMLTYIEIVEADNDN